MALEVLAECWKRVWDRDRRPPADVLDETLPNLGGRVEPVPWNEVTGPELWVEAKRQKLLDLQAKVEQAQVAQATLVSQQLAASRLAEQEPDAQETAPAPARGRVAARGAACGAQPAPPAQRAGRAAATSLLPPITTLHDR